MEQGQDGNDLLVEQIRELQLTCEIWIASNEAKEARIAKLEQEVERSHRRIIRLSRQIGRQRGHELQRSRRITQAR